nr:MAG TPA: hypothetical protein [Caudoviricetes sp.]
MPLQSPLLIHHSYISWQSSVWPCNWTVPSLS